MIVYISLGSNIDADKNIRSALVLLKKEQPEMLVSPMYQTSAVGFEGDDFLNCIAKIITDKSADDIFAWFRQIEADHGRDRNQPKFASRSLDIDMLTYGDKALKTDNYTLPRDEITKYAFVLKPLADIAPDEIYPPENKTYLNLWQGFDATGQDMKEVDFIWE